MSASVALHGVSLGYDRQPAVRQLDATFGSGSLTAVVGPNGAGKSTLLKGLIGELAPMEGQIHLPARKVALLPQQSDIDRTFPLTVEELVAMGLWRGLGPFGGVSRTQRQRVDTACIDQLNG